MCQLCVANLGNPQRNKQAIALQLQLSARDGNKHGTGIFSTKEGEPFGWKTFISATSLMNLGRVLLSNVDSKSSNPIMGHVRDASAGIEISDENAHPFNGKRFFLAHNGRLWQDGEKVTNYSYNDNTSTSSDSLRFLQELESVSEANPDMDIVGLLNKAMEKFSGKFAFLILDGKDNSFYVVRGSSATLYKCSIYSDIKWIDDDKGNKIPEGSSPVGFLINTKKDTISEVSKILAQQFQLTEGLYYYTDEPEELEKDSVFKIDGPNIVKIGELKEKTVATTAYARPTSSSSDSFTASGKDNSSLDIPIFKFADKILSWAKAHFLSLDDVDNIFFHCMGVSLSSSDVDTINIFITEFIPKMSANKKTRKIIREVLGKHGKVYPWYYKQVGDDFQYPWMLNKASQIKKLSNVISESLKDKRK